MTLPCFDDFGSRYAAGEPQLVATTLIADLETPVSAFLKLSASRAGRCFLLESVEGGVVRGRYSMIGLDPDIVFRASGGRAEIARDALADPERFAPCSEPPLVALRALIAESRIASAAEDGLPPMAAGIFGYLGYDMVREMERLAPAKPDPIGVPDSIFLRPTLMVVFDTVRDEISVVTPVRPKPNEDARDAYARAETRVGAVVAILEGPLSHGAARASRAPLAAMEPVSNTPAERFLAMIEKAKEYIRAGDIFQVVLSASAISRALRAAEPFALYRALRRVNPAPFLCYLDFGRLPDRAAPRPRSSCACARREGDHPARSPARGLARRDARRGRSAALEAELLADPKERSGAPDCCSTSAATTSAASPPSAPSRSPTAFSSSATATSCTSSPTSSGQSRPGSTT